jgi:hypothetical protein
MKDSPLMLLTVVFSMLYKVKRGPGGMFPGGRSGVGGLQGGQSIQCTEQGTIFTILQGVNDASKKYAVTSSHVVQKKSCHCSGCTFYKDAMPYRKFISI